MNVYIASMNMRGEWAKAPDNCKKINVTSAQQKASRYRIDLSPMTHIPGDIKDFIVLKIIGKQVNDIKELKI
tara:strand:- start:395 stop:610 length:216 start_codon:yes stop_codon:yes gene_type:complete